MKLSASKKITNMTLFTKMKKKLKKISGNYIENSISEPSRKKYGIVMKKLKINKSILNLSW
jgi:hypothetical protein